MSQEVFELIKSLNANIIAKQLVLQCAPVISGLKVSNLLTIQSEHVDELKVILGESDISAYLLFEKNKRTTILLYKQNEIEEHLSQNMVKTFLIELGYDISSINTILPNFKKRYLKYVNNQELFPHEMGILLGYPIEDVMGFIRNQGKNFLITGYWKVYKDIYTKEQLFCRFEEVKETMIQLLLYGLEMKDIISIYNDKNLLAVLQVCL